MKHTPVRLAGGALSVITAGTAVVGVARAAAPDRPDRAYGIFATGAAPIEATPFVRSRDGRMTTETGAAGSSDGTVSIGAATVTAGRGTASATVTDLRAFDGLVSASRVTASCDNGAVTSHADGPRPGALGRRGSIAYAVQSTDGDGTTTIIGMQVRVRAAAGVSAATINVASATCAAPASTPSTAPTSASTSPRPSPTGPRPSPTTGRPTPSRPANTAPTTVPVPPNPAPPGGGTATVNPTAQPLPDSRSLTAAPKSTPRKTHVPVTG